MTKWQYGQVYFNSPCFPVCLAALDMLKRMLGFMAPRKINLEDVKRRLLARKEFLDEVEGMGICGSLARGDFRDRSDIDVFVIIKEEDDRPDVDEIWYQKIKELMGNLRRDITVIIYTLEGLKAVPTWHTIRLASEGVIACDKGKVRETFQRIVEKARKAGLVERKIGKKKVWMVNRPLRRGEIIEVKVE